MPSSESCTECGASGEIWNRGRYGLCVPCADSRDGVDHSPYDMYDDDDEYDMEEMDGSGRGIYSYDYKPTPHFFGGADKPWHMGFELEISADTYDTTPIYNWAETHGCEGLFYCKEDGSVDGFEIVSHPMTPEFFDSVPWDNFFAMINAQWPVSRNEPNGHGLHVHVSRTAFDHRSTLARWNYLMNHYEEHVCRVARRTASHWAQFTPYPVRVLLPYDTPSRGRYVNGTDPLPCGCCYERIYVETRPMDRVTRQFQSVCQQERYQAVNLTNAPTVEVRVFRSTRKVEEFISSVHFVAATVDFVRTMQPWHATRNALAWETFTDYVASHPVFSLEREILTGTIPPPSPDTATPSAVREWARLNDIPVGMRGRISSILARQFADAAM